MADTSNGLKITLRADGGPFKDADDVSLIATFENVGNKPFSLTFWWNRFIKVQDSDGNKVTPIGGPVLPCGVKEETETLEPGQTFERNEGLACTQPAGSKPLIGWAYKLKPGKYKVKLIFKNPPSHGHAPNEAPDAWEGKTKSNTVEMIIE